MTSASNRAKTDRWSEEFARLVPVEEALAPVLAAVHPLPPVELRLLDALGLVSASTTVATEDVPPFTNSAMDGFAVRARDTAGASSATPVSLAITGAIAAGETAGATVKPGQAVRIMTGAPLPEGADAVVRFEETDNAEGDEHIVRVHRAVSSHENVRFAGEDLRAGDRVIPAGMVVNAPALGMLASLGLTSISVHRRPRVGILSTGNELVAADGETGAGIIRDSNSTTLAALVLEAGGLPLTLGTARDEMRDLRVALRRAVDDFRPDLLVTSGGVSVGDFDMVKDALQAEGQIGIWQVRMKPGKPLAFGMVADVPLLGLPGNPVAAAISFLQFGGPAIRRMMGRADVAPPTVCAFVSQTIANPGARRQYVRARLNRDNEGRLVATPMHGQGAGILSSLAAADGLVVVPEEHMSLSAGSRVTVQVLRGIW